jgi:tRNA threonylcarbamoyladenosine biosynthesis protein TsaE
MRALRQGWWRISLALCLSVAALLTCAGRASAHPHVFIDNRVKALFQGGRLTGFDLEWHFDSLFTAGALPQRDLSAGPLSAQEIATLHQTAFENLRHYSYFVHCWQGTRPVPVLRAERFTAQLDGDRLVYRFFARLATPVDLKAGAVTADFYDETYFVDVEFPEDEQTPVTMVGAPAGCRLTTGEDSKHKIPLWGFSPPGVTIACT